MVKKTVFMFLALVFCQCMTWEPLRIKRTDNLSGKLRLDGYYYCRSESFERGPILDILFLFENGVLQNPGVMFGLDFDRTDAYLLRGYGSKEYLDVPYRWGVYKVEGQNILMERWAPGPEKERYFKKGSILNDSTFALAGDSRQDTFHFRYLSSKPDSTNRFVK